MYEEYWQLERRPFENAADPRFYYPGESHQGALLKLRYVVEARRGAAALTGPSGVGKTMVAQFLARQLGEVYRPRVHLVFPQMSAPELLAYLADELAAPATGGRSIDQSVVRIERFLIDNATTGRHALVIIDEAQLLDGPHALEAMRLLLNITVHGQAPLTLLLVGDTGLLPALDRMPTLEERLGVKSLLRPFTRDETASYVSHRMQAAGAERVIFEPDSFDAIHEATHGLARRINRLCELALLVGYAEERNTVGREQIEGVHSELVDVSPE